MEKKNNILIILAGPTAVGKTACSIEIARHFDAEIFSGDSRQIYREMSIGTAKVTEEEMQGIRHHMIGHISIEEKYDVGRYEYEVKEKLNKYYKRKNIALLTGGTGLYIKAITEGLDTFPEIPDEINHQLHSELEQNGIEVLQKELRSKDPEYFMNVDLKNPRRLLRALSVIRYSGKTYSSFLNKKKKQNSFYLVKILLDRPREELYERINLRVDEMLTLGLIDEAKQLYPYKEFRSLQTVGYQELFQYFDGQLSLEGAVDLIKQNSRRYAKRQLTWFRKEKDWVRFHPKQINQILKEIETAISKHP